MIPFPNKKYKTIYADPPWNEQGAGKIKRGADRHYPLMKTEDIKNLPVQNIAVGYQKSIWDNPIEPKDMVNMTKWTWIQRLMRR